MTKCYRCHETIKVMALIARFYRGREQRSREEEENRE